MRERGGLAIARWAGVVLLTAAVFQTSCFTTHSTIMDEWVGKSETDLVSSLGAPGSSWRLDNGKVLHTWTTLWGTKGTVNTCRRTFTIGINGDIESWSSSGCRWLSLRF